MNLREELARIQQELKAPKSQYNSFGKYKYRNLEDILEAVKPLLNGVIFTLSDTVEAIGQYNYVKAEAKVEVPGDEIAVTAYAREADQQKGMNPAQISGSTSSYARKYAVNGLFLIDDTKDDDFNNTGKGKTKPQDEEIVVVPDLEDIDAATGLSEQKKVQPEASQESDTPRQSAPKWSPSIWMGKIKRIKSINSMQKQVKEAIKSGILKVVFEQFPVERDMLIKKYDSIKGETTEGLGAFLIAEGWKIPKMKAEAMPPSEDIEKDVKEVFGQPQIDPEFQKPVAEKMDAMKIDMGDARKYVNWETFDKFLDLQAGQKELTREAFVKQITTFAKSDETMLDRMMDKYLEYIEKEIGV
jgi:hypothetical protein